MKAEQKKYFNPLVTIIIPVYNGDKYLAEAINSAVGQTYSNIEILLIDDGSTDRTKEIVERYRDKVRYIYQKNSGVAAALNLGITKSSGRFISWLSHDDIFHCDKIAKQVLILAEIPEGLRDITFIYSSFEEMNEDLYIYGKFEPQKKFSISKLEHSYAPAIFGLINGCTTLIAKELFDVVGLFNEDLRYTQDIDMWFRIISKANLKFQSDVTLISRKHKLQGTNDINTRKDLEHNDLYKGMVNKLTKEEMVVMSGSEIQFLKEVLKFVYDIKYMDAARYIEERLRMLNVNSNRSFKHLVKNLLKKAALMSPYYRKLQQTENQQARINSKIDYLLSQIEALNSKKEEKK